MNKINLQKRKKFDLFFVLSGGIIKNKNGSWRTTTYEDVGDKSGVVGDRMRIIATVYLAKENPEAKIIVSGGRGYQTIDSSAPEISKVMKNELINLGISEQQIITESESNNSFEQLQYLCQIILDQRVAIVSNRYHLPRLQAMIHNFGKLENLRKKNIIFISAEDIVISHNPKRWQSIIDEAYKTVEMKKRIKLEQLGIKQIKDGTYKVI